MSRNNPNSVASFLMSLLVLTAITWSLGLLDIQFKAETTLAFDSGFPGDPKQWQLAGDPDNISLTPNSVTIERNTDNNSYALRKFSLEHTEVRDLQLRVRGVITTLKQASRTKVEDVAAYMIWFQDENSDTIQYTTIQTLSGDFPEYRAERIVRVPEEARFFTTALINRASDGSFALSDASVTVVKTTLLYKLIRPAIFLLWLCLVFLAIKWLITHGGYKVGLVIGIFLALTLIGILIPETVTNNVVFPAYKKLATALSLGHSEPLGIYYKIGHFLFFFASTLTLMLNRQRLALSVGIIIMLMLIFAIATEGLQLHLYNRSTRLTDIGIDVSGIALAVLIGLSPLIFRRKATHKDNDEAL